MRNLHPSNLLSHQTSNKNISITVKRKTKEIENFNPYNAKYYNPGSNNSQQQKNEIDMALNIQTTRYPNRSIQPSLQTQHSDMAALPIHTLPSSLLTIKGINNTQPSPSSTYEALTVHNDQPVTTLDQHSKETFIFLPNDKETKECDNQSAPPVLTTNSERYMPNIENPSSYDTQTHHSDSSQWDEEIQANMVNDIKIEDTFFF